MGVVRGIHVVWVVVESLPPVHFLWTSILTRMGVWKSDGKQAYFHSKEDRDSPTIEDAFSHP